MRSKGEYRCRHSLFRPSIESETALHRLNTHVIRRELSTKQGHMEGNAGLEMSPTLSAPGLDSSPSIRAVLRLQSRLSELRRKL